MIDYGPIELQASISDLMALGQKIDSIGIIPMGDLPFNVWIETDGQPLLITVASLSLARQFEVFTLELRRQTTATRLTAPPETTAWPLQNWPVSVLIRRDWLADPEQIPDCFQSGRWPFELKAGEIPPGAKYACWVAVGLVFEGATEQILIAASPDIPLTVLLSRDKDTIEAFSSNCQSVRLSDYVNRLKT